MSDERSERLRKRRKRSSQQAPRSNGESSDARENTDDATTAESDDTGTTDDGKTGSVKEERTGTYMYLPDDQLKELKRLYNVLKAEYEFEFDEQFEKNRHFYPLVVQCGLDGLDEMDVSDVREKLTEV